MFDFEDVAARAEIEILNERIERLEERIEELEREN